MYARKARKSPAMGMAAAPPARTQHRWSAPPLASLSGIPALNKDDPGPSGPAQAPAQAPPPVAAPKRTVWIMPISVGSSSRDPYPDIAKAAQVWAQCGVQIKSMIGKCWNSNVLDKLDPKDVLNEFSDAKNPTAEEIEMVGYQPGGSSVIHAYYVPGLSAKSRGENIRKGNSPTLPESLIVSDSAATDTLAHELGHILLGDGTHHGDPDNLMAPGAMRNVGVDKLDDTQCGKI